MFMIFDNRYGNGFHAYYTLQPIKSGGIELSRFLLIAKMEEK